MKIWIGAILFSFLITTKQQSQNADTPSENEGDLASSVSPLSSSIIFSNIPIPIENAGSQIPLSSLESKVILEHNKDTAGHSNHPPIAEKIPGPVKIYLEPVDDLPVIAKGRAELEEPQTDALDEINLKYDQKEEKKETSSDIAAETPVSESKPEPGTPEEVDKISIITEQEVLQSLTTGSDSEGDSNVKSEDVESDFVLLPPITEDEGDTGPGENPENVETLKEEDKAVFDEIIADTSKGLNKSEEDSIPSFSEWTKLQLAQRKESIINNIKDKTSLQEGKNFASPDCGAKIVASNQEAQNPSGAISSSHDEYMLNRCTSNTWLVLELCETLRIEKVALGNLELFSSSPNEFELGVSDRYPSRDWTTIGPFFAPAFRNLHSFQLPTNDSTFGKFLRVVVKSHHGKEHYCPLSLIKVFGKSEYEVLESETTHAEDLEQSNNAMEEETNGHDEPSTQSVLGSATEAVLQMVKNAANGFVWNVSEIEPPHSTSIKNNQSCISMTLTQCIPEILYKEEIIENLSCKSKLLSWLQHVTSWCGWEYCHELLTTRSIGSPWMPEGLAIAMYGPPIIDTLCNYLKPMNSCDLIDDEPVVQLTNGVPNDTQSTEAAGTAAQNQVPPSPYHDAGVIPNPKPNEQQQQQQHNKADETISPPPPQVNLPLLTEDPPQKESVFVRFSNRIKNLERNQSLSSGYLEELSRRFKKQSEELNLSHDLFRKTLNESLSKCKSVEESLRYHVKRLSRNNENLRGMIWRVEFQRVGIIFFSIIQLVCTIIFWWRSRRSVEASSTSAIANSKVQGVSSAASDVSQRKRSNSEQLKKVKKKKKKNEGFNNSGDGAPNVGFNFRAPVLNHTSSYHSSATSSQSTLINVPNKSDRERTTTDRSKVLSHESQPTIKKKSKFMSLMSFGNKNPN